MAGPARPSTTVYIWVRATTSWDDEQAFRAQLRPEFKPKVDLWNETFNIPFHAFRHRLRQIAHLNLSRVENAVCASWDEIPEGALVIPVDDDDWLAPDVGTVLASEYEPRATGYYWISSFIEIPINFRHRLGLVRRAIFPRTPPKWICTTNNYAIRKESGTKTLLALHTHASEWFRREAGRVKRIEKRLSVMNRTLASQTSLGFRKPFITRSELIRKFHKYKTLYTRPRDPELDWCRAYLAMMADVMDELKTREGG